MSQVFITCYKMEQLTDENYEQYGFWLHDPYNAVLMLLVGRDFLSDRGDPWKQAEGAELVRGASAPSAGWVTPRLWQYQDSLERLIAFRDAYRRANKFLATFGEVLPDRYIKEHMNVPLLAGDDDIPISHLREAAQDIVRLIDRFIEDRFPVALQ